jgi:hypothetical protein
MIGTPTAIVKATLTVLVPPSPMAVKLAVKEPFVVGVPVIAPVLASSDSPTGNPVAAQLVTGRFALSVSERLEGVNATPTLPEKLCPATIIGGPTAIEIVTSSVSVPPGPVAVSVSVMLPRFCGVPVIAPVVGLSVAQLGSP